jgi:hypothetical protein
MKKKERLVAFIGEALAKNERSVEDAKEIALWG